MQRKTKLWLYPPPQCFPLPSAKFIKSKTHHDVKTTKSIFPQYFNKQTRYTFINISVESSSMCVLILTVLMHSLIVMTYKMIFWSRWFPLSIDKHRLFRKTNKKQLQHVSKPRRNKKQTTYERNLDHNMVRRSVFWFNDSRCTKIAINM